MNFGQEPSGSHGGQEVSFNGLSIKSIYQLVQHKQLLLFGQFINLSDYRLPTIYLIRHIYKITIYQSLFMATINQ